MLNPAVLAGPPITLRRSPAAVRPLNRYHLRVLLRTLLGSRWAAERGDRRTDVPATVRARNIAFSTAASSDCEIFMDLPCLLQQRERRAT